MTRRRKIKRPSLDPRFCQIMLDANSLDRIDATQSELVDRFHSCVDRLQLSVIKPQSVEREIGHPNTPKQVRKDMAGIYTISVGLTHDEVQKRAELRKLMIGNSTSNRHVSDADHLFEAAKYGGGYFVTHDRRYHLKSSKIVTLVPSIKIVSLLEIVDICNRL